MDITTYALLKKKIDSLGISDAKIQEVIETFLLAHPEYIGATDEQVAQIAANAAAIQELQADAVKIVTLDEYNAFTDEQKKEKIYLIWDKDTDNVKADLDVITLDEYNALSDVEKKKRDYLIYNEEQVENSLTIDSELNKNSSNPICNSTVTKELEEITTNIGTLEKSVQGIKDSLNDKVSATDIQYGTITLSYLSSTVMHGEKELEKDIYGATVSLVAKSDTKHLNVTGVSMNCSGKIIQVTATGVDFASGDTIVISYIAIV